MPPPVILSIITVTLNNAQGLQKTGQSLAKQTRQDFEWIVMDGGSTDATAQTLGTFPHAPDFYATQPDDGLYDAMNKGIAHAHGRYVLFLNAGDTLANDSMLAKLYTVLEDKQPDLLYGDSYERLQNGKRYYKSARPHTKAAQGMFTHHQSILYKYDLLKEMRFSLNYPIAADYDLTLRFLKKAQHVTYLPHALSIYQAGGISQTCAGQGRAEQFLIRQQQGTLRPAMNVLIYFRQLGAWTVRRFIPGVYWFLKRSGQSGDNKDSGSAPA